MRHPARGRPRRRLPRPLVQGCGHQAHVQVSQFLSVNGSLNLFEIQGGPSVRIVWLTLICDVPPSCPLAQPVPPMSPHFLDQKIVTVAGVTVRGEACIFYTFNLNLCSLQSRCSRQAAVRGEPLGGVVVHREAILLPHQPEPQQPRRREPQLEGACFESYTLEIALYMFTEYMFT